MSIVAAFMVPHPPMIVPQVRQGSEVQIEKTRRAYEQVAEEIEILKPETIIISSPHATMYADYFHISPGSRAKGSFERFRASELDVKRYGVIVSSGSKRGLLLPDLDGVDTVEQQISIAMQMGGISQEECVTLQRFEVTRHI